MKRLLLLVVLFSLSFSGLALAQNLPQIGGGAVTIPWDDFKALLEKMQGVAPVDDPPPPVDFTLGRGSLSGTLDNGALELTATYPLSVLKKGWVICPLVGSSTPLADVQIDGKTAPVTENNGVISLVVHGPVAHTLTLRFRIAAPMRPGPGVVELALPQAAGQVLNLKVGAKVSGVTVDGATVSESPGGVIAAILTGDQLNVHYTVALEKIQETQEKLPVKVVVENSSLVSIDEGFIRTVVQLDYEVRHAAIAEFKVQIPEGFEVADCAGASLATWKLDDQSRILTATIGFEVKGAYSLTLVLERSTKDESFTFALPEVQALDVERERGFFAVQVTGGVEVSANGEVQGLQVVDVKELPAALRGGATNPIVLSFKYLRHPFAAELQVVRHKTQMVLGAAIDEANYVVQLTEDGDCVTRAVYTVRNNRKQFLELTLPDVDKMALWSSFVADKPVRPSKTAEGKILLPLEKSSYAGAELDSFTVEIIYYSNLGSGLHGLGDVGLQMPEVDLPISRSSLTVFAPERYRYSRWSGSLQEAYAERPGLLPVLGATAPEPDKMAEENKDESAYSLRRKSISVKQSDAEQVFQQRIRAAQEAQDTTGSLPARFSVPQQGQALRFQELITIGEASTLRLFYFSRRLGTLLVWLTFALSLVAMWYLTKMLSGWRPAGRSKILLIGAIVVVAALVLIGISLSYVFYGAALTVAWRFFRWVYGQIMLNARPVPKKSQ